MHPNHHILRSLAAILTLSISAALAASLPAGAVQYNSLQINTCNLPDISNLLINNNGQIAWITPKDTTGFKIINLYSNGSITKIPYDNSGSALGIDINDKSEVVWQDFANVYIYSNDSVTIIYSDIISADLRRRPGINNNSQIAFSTCVPNNERVLRYENGNISTIYGPSTSAINSVAINDKSQIAFCGVIPNAGVSPNKVCLYENGTTTTIADCPGSWVPSSVEINDNGRVIYVLGYKAYLWEPGPGGGNTTQIPVDFSNNHNGISIHINDFGQIVWEDNGKIYLWDSNDHSSSPSAVFDGYYPTINNLGQIAYWTTNVSAVPPYNYGTNGIYLATPQVEVAKKTYAVCIGSRKYKAGQNPAATVELRADWGAALMVEKLLALTKNVKPFIGDFDTGGIKKSDIKNYLNGLSVNPDDLLIFYVHGHGNQTDNKQYYYVEIGPDTSTPDSEGFLSDADLLAWLQNKDCNKWVIIDACHSGGFQKELSKLNKLGLLTATGTYGSSVSWFLQYGWFTQGLAGALSIKNGRIVADTMEPTGKLSFGELACYMTDLWPLTQEFQSAAGTTMYELAFGDPAVFTAYKYNPAAIKTDGLKGIGLSGNAIPAINLLLLD